MKNKLISILCCCLLFISGCTQKKTLEDVKIGVSFGVGEAIRWVNEERFMKERASELGVQIESRLNKYDKPKTQVEDCKELIDSGIDVLILIPRDANHVEEILQYAHDKDVEVISYARIALGVDIDLFIGYDSYKIGQMMGQFLTEMVIQGDYIILSGDENDNNAKLLYDGAMRYIDPLRDEINILYEGPVANWSTDTAKDIVRKAISENGNHVNAILAPNDKIANACIEVVKELGVENHVVITGMDSDIDAARNIVNGDQDMTIYMSFSELATIAIDEAVHMAMNENVNVNSEFDNGSEQMIDSYLINGKLVIKKNLDSVLIDSGHFTREEVYN